MLRDLYRTVELPVKSLIAFILFVTVLVPAGSATADTNPATEDLVQDCDVRPDSTPVGLDQSGVQAAVPGEWVNFIQVVEFDEGDVYQDILLRPDGSTFYASRLELTALPSGLDVDLASVEFRIAPGTSIDPYVDGVVQPTVPGTEPDVSDWVIHADSTIPDTKFSLYFPGDVTQMIAGQPGFGEFSYSVPAGGEKFVLSFRAQVPASTSWGTVHTGAECFAAVSTGESNRDTSRITAAVSVFEPIVEIDKSTALANVYNPGQNVEYVITVTVPEVNPADSSQVVAPARDVIVTDTVPVGLIPLDANGDPVADGGTTDAGGVWNATTREVTYQLGDILPGDDIQITYDMQMDADAGLLPTDPLVNTASAGFSFLPAGTDGNTVVEDYVSDDATVLVASSAPSVNKDADIERTGTGLPFTYTVTVDIPANAQYENFSIFDTLPDGLEFVQYVSATCTPAGATCPSPIPTLAETVFPAGGTTIGWYPDTMVADPNPRQIVLTYEAQISESYNNGDEVVFFDEFTNDLQVRWNAVDRLGAVVPSTASQPTFDGTVGDDDVVIYDRPILTIDKTVETSDGFSADTSRVDWDYEVGDIATYTSVITNEGSRDATNLTVTDTPVGLDIDPATITIDGALCGAACTWDGTTLTIPVAGPVAAFGGTVTIAYDAIPTQNGAIDNLIEIPSYFDDLGVGTEYTENPSDTVPLNIPDPELTISKARAGATDTIANTIGTTYPFTITVTNSSAVTAYSPQVIDTPPEGLCMVAGSLANVSGDSTVTQAADSVFDIDDPLAPGESVSFDVTVVVCGPPVVEPGDYTNTVDLTWSDLTDNTNEAGDTYGASDTEDITLVGPEFEIEKLPPIDGGASLNYTYDVNENGTIEYSTATGEMVSSEVSSAAWTFIIKNTSPVPIGGLEIDDPMPDPFEYLPGDIGTQVIWIGQAPSTFTDNSVASGTAVLAGHTEQVDFTLGQLEPGAEVRIIVPFSHNGEDPSDGDLTRVNTVTARNDNLIFDADLHQADGEYTLIPVEVGPEISKTVETPGTYPGVEQITGAPGQQFDYSIDVSLQAHATLWNYDLWVLDELPDGLSLVNEPATGAVPNAGGWTVSCVSGPCPATEGGVYLGSQTTGTLDTELAWFLGDTPPDATEQVSVYRITFRVEMNTTFADGEEIIDGINDPLINNARPVFNRDLGSGNLVAGAPSAGVPDTTTYDRLYPKDPAAVDIVTPRLDFEKNVYDENDLPVTEIDAGETVFYEIIVTNAGSGDAFDIDIRDDLGNPDGIPYMDVNNASLNATPAGVVCNFVNPPVGGQRLFCEFPGGLAGDPDGAGPSVGGQIVITYEATTVPAEDFHSQFSTQNQDPMIMLNRAATSEYYDAAGESGNQYSTGQAISRLFAFTPVAEVDNWCGPGLVEAAPGSTVQFRVVAGNGDRYDTGGNPDGDLTLTPHPTEDLDGDGYPDAGVGYNPELRVTLQDKFTFQGVQATGPGAGDDTYTNYVAFPPDQILDEVEPNTYTLVWNTSLEDIPHSPDHETEADFLAHYDLLIDVTKTEAGGGSLNSLLTFEDAAGNTDRGTGDINQPFSFSEIDRQGCPGGPPPRVEKGPNVEDAIKIAPGGAGEFTIVIQQPLDDPMAGNFVDVLPEGLTYAGDLPVTDPNYAVATMTDGTANSGTPAAPSNVPGNWTDVDGNGVVELEDYFTSSSPSGGGTAIQWDPPPLETGNWVLIVPVVAEDDPPFPNEFVVNSFNWNTDLYGTRKDTGALLTEGAGQPSISKRVADQESTYGDNFRFTIDVTIPAGFAGQDVLIYDEINRRDNWDSSPYTLQSLGQLNSHATIFPVQSGWSTSDPGVSGELNYANWAWTPAEMELSDYVSQTCVTGCSGGADDIVPVPLTPTAMDETLDLPLNSTSDGVEDNHNGAIGWYLGDIAQDPEGQDRTVRLVYEVEAPTLDEQRQRVFEQNPTNITGFDDPKFDDTEHRWFHQLSQVNHPNLVRIRSYSTNNTNLQFWDGLGDTAWQDAPSTAWFSTIGSNGATDWAFDDEHVTVAYPLIEMEKDCGEVGNPDGANPEATALGTPNIECKITVTNTSPVDAHDVTITDTPLEECRVIARSYYGEVRYINTSNQFVAGSTATDPDNLTYPCEISGVQSVHPGLTTTANQLPASWQLSLGPNETQVIDYKVRVDGWQDLPAVLGSQEFNSSWEVMGSWVNQAVLAPWADTPGGTTLGSPIEVTEQANFTNSSVIVDKFPFPENINLLTGSINPGIDIYTDPAECSVNNLWPYRHQDCGSSPRSSFDNNYAQPLDAGDPYAGDYWMNQQPDAHADVLQPISRRMGPYNYPMHMRGYLIGKTWPGWQHSGWWQGRDNFTLDGTNNGWWHNPLSDVDSWSDIYDADPTQPYQWAININVNGMERVTDLDISDRLPYGWRYVPGSAKIVDGTWYLGWGNTTFAESAGVTPSYSIIDLDDPVVDPTTEGACGVSNWHEQGQTLNWRFEKDGGEMGSDPWDVRYIDSRDRASDHPSYPDRAFSEGESDVHNWIRIHYKAIPDPLVFDCDPDTTDTTDYFMENNVQVDARVDYDPALGLQDNFAMLAPVPNPLAFEKTPDDGTVPDDSSTTFEITFTNGMDVAAEDLIISDTLTATVGGNPASPLPGGGYTCGSATATGITGTMTEQTCTGGNTGSTSIDWHFDRIEPGETVVISIPIEVPIDETNGLIWGNSATTTVKEWYDTAFTDEGQITVVAPSPPVVPTKTVTPNPATVNDYVTYEVSWTANAYQVWLDLAYIDLLPDGVTFDEYQGVTCSGACPTGYSPDDVVEIAPTVNGDGTTSLSWWFGDMPGSSGSHTWTMKYRVRVDDTYNDGTTEVIDGDILNNTVTGYSNEENLLDDPPATTPDPAAWTTFPPSAPATVDFVIAEPELEIRKAAVAAPDPADGSSVLTFTIEVENTGDIAAYAVNVSDEPSGALENAVANPTTFPGSVVTRGWTSIDPVLGWFIPAIEPGETAVFTYTAEVVDTYLADGFGTADNVATIESYRARGGLEPEPGDRVYEGSSAESSTPLAGPNLDMFKYSGNCADEFSFAEQGQPHAWCIEVQNLGDAIAYGAQVSDTLPFDWTYDTGSTTGTGWAPAEPAVSVVSPGVEETVWNVGDIGAGGTVFIEFTATPGADSPLNVTNRAVVESFQVDGSPIPITVAGARANDPASSALGQHALEISKTPDRQEYGILPTGNTATWTLTITNPASDTGNTDLVVTDFLPQPFVFQSAVSADARVSSASAGGFGSGPGGTSPVTWTISDLGAGESIEIELVAAAPGGLVLEQWYVNDVQVTSAEIPDEVVNQAKVRFVEPAIDIEKETNGVQADTPVGPAIAPDAAVTWTYTVTNSGPTAMVPATVTDLPAPAGGISCEDHRGDTNDDNVIDVFLPGDSVVCTATGTAVAGQFSNNATVTGNPSLPDPDTCGCDPDDSSTWPDDETLYNNLTDSSGADLPDETDEDPSHYFGADPGIDVEKDTNGVDADGEWGPGIAPGADVVWTYVVENTGNTSLVAVTVTDSEGVEISCADHYGDTDGDNVIDVLAPGDVVTCVGTGTAIAGQYSNDSDVSGTPVLPDPSDPGVDIDDPATWPTDPDDLDPVVDEEGEELPDETDEDPSHYYGADPGVDIEKDTNGVDADSPVGPALSPDDVVTWTYVVENTGNTILANVTVTDSEGVVISCADHHGDTDGDHIIDLMLPGDVVTCTGTGTAIAGQYSNDSGVSGTPVLPDPASPGVDIDDPATWPTDPTGTVPIVDETGEPLPDVDDEDPSHYYGARPGIDVEKSTNGYDSDEAPGNGIPVGDEVTWTYVVENTGDTILLDVTVVDSEGVEISCADHLSDTDGDHIIRLMLPGDVVECTGSGEAIDGQYRNDVDVTGNPVVPDPETCGCEQDDPTTWPTDPSDPTLFEELVDPETGEPIEDPTDEDPSHYYGSDGGVDIEKSTNTVDADIGPGPGILPGDTVTWTYDVVNTSDTALIDVTVTDDQGVTVTCADHRGDVNGDSVIDLMHPGDLVVCTGTGTAVAGQYTNNGSVEGTPVLPDPDVCGCDTNDPSTWPDDPELYEPVIDPETGEPYGPVSDDDDSHYYGSEPSMDLEKSTNGRDQDEPEGAEVITAGDTVTWTYTVTNTGNTAFTSVAVTDDDTSITIDCGGGSNVTSLLLPGESYDCQGSAPAIGEAYRNVGSVDGVASVPNPETCGCDPNDPSTWPSSPELYVPLSSSDGPLPVLSASDPSHYSGVANNSALAFTGTTTGRLITLAGMFGLTGLLLLLLGRFRRRAEA